MKIKNAVTLPCAACDGKATFTAEGERPTFFHTIPYCRRFDETNDVDSLLRYWKDCVAKDEAQKRK